MPILPEEPDGFPADLWTEGGDEPPCDGRVWWCLHVKPRQEKALARDLWQAEKTFYLPQIRRESRTPQGRTTRSTVPLFPGYVFVRGAEEDRLEVLRTNRIAHILDVIDQTGLVHDLRQIHRLLASGLPIAPETTFPIGSRVKISQGPLQGLVGKVVKRDKKRYFVSVVGFLNCGASVELLDWQLETFEDDKNAKQSDSGIRRIG